MERCETVWVHNPNLKRSLVDFVWFLAFRVSIPSEAPAVPPDPSTSERQFPQPPSPQSLLSQSQRSMREEREDRAND